MHTSGKTFCENLPCRHCHRFSGSAQTLPCPSPKSPLPSGGLPRYRIWPCGNCARLFSPSWACGGIAAQRTGTTTQQRIWGTVDAAAEAAPGPPSAAEWLPQLAILPPIYSLLPPSVEDAFSRAAYVALFTKSTAIPFYQLTQRQ